MKLKLVSHTFTIVKKIYINIFLLENSNGRNLVKNYKIKSNPFLTWFKNRSEMVLLWNIRNFMKNVY